MLTQHSVQVPAGAIEHRPGPPAARLEVLAAYRHDAAAFTQGLEWCDGLLYESSGGVGTSDLRVADPGSGFVRRRVAVPDVFGEGIAIVGDDLWHLTWRDGVVYLRDRHTLAVRTRIRVGGEGWGLCYAPDLHCLFVTDGTDRLILRDPVSFEVRATVRVSGGSDHLGERFPMMLNDLTWSQGRVWANVYPTDEIVGIDPKSGRIVASVDASVLHDEQDLAVADVLNGITAIPNTDRFLITGKRWARMYEVRWVVPGHRQRVEPEAEER